MTVSTSDRDVEIQAAREAMNAAAIAWQLESNRYQNIDKSNRAAVNKWAEQTEKLGESYVQAKRLVLRLEGPSFNDVLRDPTLQMTPANAALRSIIIKF